MFDVFVENLLINSNNIKSNIIVFICLLLFFCYACYTDIKYMKIYDKFNLLLIVSRFLFIFVGFKFTFEHLLGGIVGFLILFIPAVYFLFKMGGDIKFITAIGLYVGPEFIILLLGLSCFFMYSLYLIKRYICKIKNIDVSTKVAFAPYFFASYLVILLLFK